MTRDLDAKLGQPDGPPPLCSLNMLLFFLCLLKIKKIKKAQDESQFHGIDKYCVHMQWVHHFEMKNELKKGGIAQEF